MFQLSACVCGMAFSVHYNRFNYLIIRKLCSNLLMGIASEEGNATHKVVNNLKQLIDVTLCMLMSNLVKWVWLLK